MSDTFALPHSTVDEKQHLLVDTCSSYVEHENIIQRLARVRTVLLRPQANSMDMA